MEKKYRYGRGKHIQGRGKHTWEVGIYWEERHTWTNIKIEVQTKIWYTFKKTQIKGHTHKKKDYILEGDVYGRVKHIQIKMHIKIYIIEKETHIEEQIYKRIYI